MKNVKEILVDFIKAIILGLVISAAVGGVLFLAGFLAGGFHGDKGLEVGKDGLLLIASLGMFLLAGMLLSKGKKPEQFTEMDSWRKHFRIIGYKTAIGIVCAAFLTVASVMDGMM
ncbi:hypothetical protein SAMN02745136_03209 [Anaerocolumna jejuensis DSM 15929]|uniref:Uncharacterized protein n=1 Tax=Anaerocolumna jejuensis DSM 15929 TaxID=1121322 RepID=A0A1M6UW52_9FIRM|nr:hypothetical protein [Anaerocolumna jejuensis]SHK73371.1 hypothetical protein SAMN02745136_03209 [Anaerocolumna jejuensis DSM 15929]